MDWESTRDWFPVTRELIYLNHAGVAPISTRVRDALARFSREALERGAFQYEPFFDTEIERTRGHVATLLGAETSEIAFVKNTTEGLGIVAAGLDWQPGDRVVGCDLEYPSNVYPWWNLRERGVETILLPGRDGVLPLESIEAALRSGNVRVVALSSVEFGSGARNDLVAIGALCREHGALFCVDAIQSLGCLPIDVREAQIDYLAADGHKWLLSVEGCGVFFCASRALEYLTPRIVGWRSVTANQDFDRYHLDLQPTAGRFEEGTPNTAGIFALGAAVDLLLELGIDSVEERVGALTDHLVRGLRERGATIESPREPGLASGIVAFTLGDEAPKATARRLRRAGVFVVARRGCVRASPHFYNSSAELDELVAAL